MMAVPKIRPCCKSLPGWDGITWELAEEWSGLYVNDEVSFYILIKEGFKTDFGSIPKFAWSLVGHPLDKSLMAYFVHDALYAGEFYERKTCDNIMYNMQKWLGESWYKRKVCYQAVDKCGWYVWNKHTPEIIADTKKYVQLI
jgi:hypothetical protein